MSPPFLWLLALKLSKSEQSTEGSKRHNQMGVGVGWGVGELFAGPQPKPTAILAWLSWARPRPPSGWPDWVLPGDRMQRQQPSRLAGRAAQICSRDF